MEWKETEQEGMVLGGNGVRECMLGSEWEGRNGKERSGKRRSERMRTGRVWEREQSWTGNEITGKEQNTACQDGINKRR